MSDIALHPVQYYLRKAPLRLFGIQDQVVGFVCKPSLSDSQRPDINMVKIYIEIAGQIHMCLFLAHV